MSPARGEVILIVEDDEGVALLERRALERRGFEVAMVTTLADALAAVQSRPFDLIVSDFRLESGTGLELVTELQNLGIDVPVILVTGFSDEATIIDAIRGGVRDFVPKSAEFLHYLPDAAQRVLKAVRTERELARSEAQFHLFMDHSPTFAFIKDEAGRLTYANRTTQQLLGHTEWLGKTDFDLWPQETAKQIRTNDIAVLNNNDVAEVFESITLPSGLTHHFLTYKFPMQDASGQRFLGGVAVDVTRQKAAEEALRQRDEQLRQSQKMEAIGALAGGIAHEFNNLLQAVLGYTRFAMSTIDEGHSAHGDLQIVVSAAERAALLTRQLLTFSRRDTGQFVPLNLNAAIHELGTMLRPLLGENVTIDLALDESIGLISADHAQIQQMLMNLCINARDAMPHGGKIIISTRHCQFDGSDGRHSMPPGKYVALGVSDTGTGMTPEVKRKLFEPFYTTKPIGKGTGLGLAIVYGTVQGHGGTIQVDSESGRGSRFTIYLPESSSGTPIDVNGPSAPVRRGSETILLAEDEQVVLELGRRMLEEAGYRVLTAADGQVAVEVFKASPQHIDLVILDAVMPRLGGWDALSAIRHLNPSVPAILASGYDPQSRKERPPGASPRLIQKPFQCDTLLQVVYESLEGVHACP